MSRARRIVSLWLPRFAAEWRLRGMGGHDGPFAIVAEEGGALRLASLNREAEAAGLGRHMGLSDARAIRPDLLTRPAAPEREAAALAALARWAMRYSPLVAAEAEALVIDATGCAHLFGGEPAMLEAMLGELADLGFSARAGMADTRGAAWALARFAPMTAAPGARDGDAIAPDARATRVRTPKRRKWARPESAAAPAGPRFAIAPPGGARRALGPLPLAALRLPADTVSRLQRLGLRRVEELTLMPRAGLARRFGVEVPLRLDQAFGATPEPVSAARDPAPIAARVSFPEPVGLAADIEAAVERLLAQVCKRLGERGLGARRLRLVLRRVDGADEAAEIGLARPGRDPRRIGPLFAPKIAALDAGFGVDAARLAVLKAEPLTEARHRGHFAARAEAEARRDPGGGEAFADLVSRLGGRIGLERITRPLPADSHIPEKAWLTAPAAWSEAADRWPGKGRIRPARLFPPEPLIDPAPGRPPGRFRWRGRDWRLTHAAGPERIAPEWWLDDPAWRSGPRDYWRVEAETGDRLWLFEARGGETGGGWFAQGELA